MGGGRERSSFLLCWGGHVLPNCVLYSFFLMPSVSRMGWGCSSLAYCSAVPGH